MRQPYRASSVRKRNYQTIAIYEIHKIFVYVFIGSAETDFPHHLCILLTKCSPFGVRHQILNARARAYVYRPCVRQYRAIIVDVKL